MEQKQMGCFRNKNIIRLFFIIFFIIFLSCNDNKKYENTAGNVDLDGDGKIDAEFLDTHASNHSVGGNDSVFPDDPGANRYLYWNDTLNALQWATGGSGSSVILDLDDDGSNESTSLGEIAVSNDTNSIFTESFDDKLLIDVSQNWPTADNATTAITATTANSGDSATAFFSSGTLEHEIGGLEANVSGYNGLLKISGGTTSEVPLSSYMQSLLDDGNESELKASINLEIGTDVQAYDVNLTTYAGITPSADVQTMLGSADNATIVSNIGAESHTSNDIDPDRLNGDSVNDDKIDAGLIADLSATYESHSSNDIDPDRLNGDTVDDNLIDDAIISTILTLETINGTPLITNGARFGTDGTDYLIDNTSNGSGSATLYIGNESILASGDIDVSVQAYDANLTTYGGITPSADVQTMLGSVDNAAIRTNIAAESNASNNFDPDRLQNDTVDNDLIDASIIDSTIARDSELPTQASLSVDDLITLSGVAEGSINLGNFSGSTISDSATIKSGMQELETALESVPGAHDPVTLATDADVLLELSTQQITLDSQSQNYIFAGPSSGSGDPTFRLLVNGDMPTSIDPDKLTGDTVDDDKVDAGLIADLSGTYELNNSNTIDPDRLNGDTVDDNLIDDAIINTILTLETISGTPVVTNGMRFGTDDTDYIIDDASNGGSSATLYIGNESILASGDIDVSVQAYDANLTTYAGITPSTAIQTMLGSANNATILNNIGAESHTSNDIDPDRLNGDSVDDDKIALSLIADIDTTYQTILTNEAGLYSALSDVSQFYQPGDLIRTEAGNTPTALSNDGEINVDTDDEQLKVRIGGATKTFDFSGDSADYVLKSDGSGNFTLSAMSGGGGGTANILDLSDDGSNESTDLVEIATTGDTNSIFTEPAADKLLIAVGNNWPTADTANSGDSATAFFSSGTLEHEVGGLEADVSAYNGLVKITSGSTSSVSISAYGESLIGLADEATLKSTVNLEIGTDVQAYDANLTTYAGITPSANVQTMLGSADNAAIVSNIGAESHTSNDIDPDRLAGDTVDDNLIDDVIIASTIARDSELPTQASLHIDSLITLSGVGDDSTNLGSFTGVTISDNGTIKAGMQELETALEGIGGDITSILDDTSGAVYALYQSENAFSDGDTTPSVQDHLNFITANTSSTTISDFDDGANGQIINVFINDSNTTIDFTSSGIEGIEEDYIAQNGEVLTFIYAATDSQWHVVRSPDAIETITSSGIVVNNAGTPQVVSIDGADLAVATNGNGTTGDPTITVTSATNADVNLGTSTTTAITPDALAGSMLGTFFITLQMTDPSDLLTVADGKIYWTVPTSIGALGLNLVSVFGAVYTVSSSNDPTFQVYNVTDSHDLLSTALIIDANEYNSSTASTAAVINTSYDDIATGDIIRIDCDVAGTGTYGGEVTLGFRLP
jgi:hypothetical protein